ncbi:MAG: ribonuclease T [Proteobacteria bacterium]|nr:ribonuclease T [Pseudomonadota bacterium]
MKIVAALWFALCLVPVLRSEAAEPFDAYVLALSWQPEFCRARPGQRECRTRTPDRYDSTHPVLHGLWPDRNGDRDFVYCGVDGATRRLDETRQWKRLPEPEMSDGTREDLRKYMPGYESFLHRHEWFAHGTCSGLSADEYFKTANALAARLGASGFGRFLASRAGRAASREELAAAFDQEYGAGASRAMLLVCRDRSALSEIRLAVRNPAPRDGELRGALVPRALGRSQCGVSVDLQGLSR